MGHEAVFFNINAADAIKRAETLDEIQERFTGTGSTVRVLLHCLAFGTLKPFIARKAEDAVNQAQMEMTLDVMANSLVYWTQGLIWRGLMKRGGRIFRHDQLGRPYGAAELRRGLGGQVGAGIPHPAAGDGARPDGHHRQCGDGRRYGHARPAEDPRRREDAGGRQVRRIPADA